MVMRILKRHALLFRLVLFLMVLYPIVTIYNQTNTSHHVPATVGDNAEKPCEEHHLVEGLFHKGKPIWQNENLKEYYLNYQERYGLRLSFGGMKLQRRFALYTMVEIIKPLIVIEVGLGEGFTAHFIRQLSEDILIISMDQRCFRQKVINQEKYCRNGFVGFKKFGQRWMMIPDKSKVLVIFDDSQTDLVERLQDAYFFGFKHVLIENDYSQMLGTELPLRGQLFGAPANDFSRGDVVRNRLEVCHLIAIYADFPPLNRSNTIEYLVNKYVSDKINATQIRKIAENKLPPGLGLPVLEKEMYNGKTWFSYVQLKHNKKSFIVKESIDILAELDASNGKYLD